MKNLLSKVSCVLKDNDKMCIFKSGVVVEKKN